MQAHATDNLAKPNVIATAFSLQSWLEFFPSIASCPTKHQQYANLTTVSLIVTPFWKQLQSVEPHNYWRSKCWCYMAAFYFLSIIVNILYYFFLSFMNVQFSVHRNKLPIATLQASITIVVMSSLFASKQFSFLIIALIFSFYRKKLLPLNFSISNFVAMILSFCSFVVVSDQHLGSDTTVRYQT